jgi:hypothetical protein
LRLSHAVAAIFSDDTLGEHLALRGGTVLHKGHLAPAARYSEDLDLVLIKSVDRNTLDARLRTILAPVLGEPSDSVMAMMHAGRAARMSVVPFHKGTDKGIVRM